VPLIVDALQLLSHVARSSSKYCEPLRESKLCGAPLRALLGHTHARVRAKTFNLLGNLCRHGTQLHGDMLASGLLGAAARALQHEADAQTRLFAAYTLGNFSFHASAKSLASPAMRAAIVPVVQLLKSNHELLSSSALLGGAAADFAMLEKTQSNLAGCLGNLVRRSDVLLRALVQANALEALLSLALRRPLHDNTRFVSRSVALFSLGNFAAHTSATVAATAAAATETMATALQLKQRFASLRVHTQLSELCAQNDKASISSDTSNTKRAAAAAAASAAAVVQKWCVRILAKLAATTTTTTTATAAAAAATNSTESKR
jgi:fused-like protein